MRGECVNNSPCFPSTRYQGSKARSAVWIVERLAGLGCNTALDAFGGTGSVAWHLKRLGMAVTYNDLLEWNRQVGLALIENESVFPDARIYSNIGARRNNKKYSEFISGTFSGVYYTDEENEWLDVAIQNIDSESSGFERSLLLYALFQACLVKRPYNLFHRANLDMRTRKVNRSFGNKTTWERPFDIYIERFSKEAEKAVFRGAGPCRATGSDVLEIKDGFDLVYLDPPYMPGTGPGIDYLDFYHFLEGLARYEQWPELADTESRRRQIRSGNDISAWTGRKSIMDVLDALFEIHACSIMALSYRDDGFPDVQALISLFKNHGKTPALHSRHESPYALSKKRNSREILLVG